MGGTSNRNRLFFEAHYPYLNLRFRTDPTLKNEEHLVRIVD